MKIAAVIPTYNRPAILRQCLESLLAQDRLLDEIQVIDNSGNNETEYLISSSFPGISYCRFQENIGSAGGFYEGIVRTFQNHDYIWTLDDDIVAQKMTLAEACARIPMLEARGNLGAFRVNYGKSKDDVIEFGSFAWRGTFIKSTAIQKIGLPDRDFFLYGEDVEYSMRLRRAGYKIFGVCAGRLSEITPSPRKSEYVLGSRFRFYSDTFRLYYAFRNQLAVHLRFGQVPQAVGIVLYGAKGFFYFLFSGKPRSCIAIVNGLFDGLRKKLGKNPSYAPQGNY
ncbi:MAG: hypothetical protein A2350_01175 [Candidatus Raymondbacteria bacterium RifOxyB12_full_50_8]|uniref:Glycosyltransferase 2-like domain-containing protein n=1 Tax=Candidatus Raymondbacteria bacterium RIFOXYD12_FULL_49_13 TaxID=1817890 RepID=A0A1F7F1Z3_UNCRA|nr:MAG: hypothetical protein A2248_07540 [Candidatus Raymondbacteria bacterium RIFOXYA2_FULL_49_16]OGJ88761.1 MAG: hypothetical protein A2350_01175 [Candidatus Raymondbacteria bacterium RifOxyB12_full_50_8]OGJ96120.1 MAG: hypothetical protein A2453_09395 [Candidatus Raymondbacteria bacterium RIFOXYC2_FULL_50_21]OGK00583.1 MAG: hypothetical protein A2519_21605 [Candidatus Raymondbacteria bacterium RIFOXYD12_FULL_49_13]OGP41127.1 MAG: hypothetical protein A2324_09790 [Candidatus Raymondbacteria b